MAQRKGMTSKERVRLSLSWQEPDRVPIQTYLTPEMEARLRQHFGKKGAAAAAVQVEPGVLATQDELILQGLGVDFRMVCPRYRGRLKPPRDGVVFDEWGTGYRQVTNSAAGTYDESVIQPLADLKTWSATPGRRSRTTTSPTWRPSATITGTTPWCWALPASPTS